MNLYEITGNLLALQDMLNEPIEDEQALIDTLEAVEGEYNLKIEGYCKVIKNLEADAVALKNEADRLNNKRKVLENNINRLKKTMFESMKTTGKTRVKGDLFSVAIQKNGGKLPVKITVDESELPDELMKITKTPNLEAISELIESGNTQYAEFGDSGESIRIR